MKKEKVNLTEIKIAGLSCRTNNLAEMDQDLAKIGKTVQSYFNAISKIQPNKGAIYSVYTDYAADHTGDYTFIIGQDLGSFKELPDDFTQITICAQQYTKFTTEPGVMPNVCIDAWKNIWQMSEAELGGKRSYKTDIEIYDERAVDPNNTILDIYIGVESK